MNRYNKCIKAKTAAWLRNSWRFITTAIRYSEDTLCLIIELFITVTSVKLYMCISLMCISLMRIL